MGFAALSSVGVPQVFFGRDDVAHELFELFDIRKTSLLSSRPDSFSVDMYFEDAACSGAQRDFANLADESCQDFLRHPGSAQQPVALCAISDSDVWTFMS